MIPRLNYTYKSYVVCPADPSSPSFPDEKNQSTIRPRNCIGHEKRLQECGILEVSQCEGELALLECKPGEIHLK